MATSKATETERYDKRTLLDVLGHDLQNFGYFFAPLVVTHNLAWLLKPFITDDPRGPWEIIWINFLETINLDHYYIYVYGTFLTTTIFYWISASIFMLMDYTQKPAFLMKYKIQPGKNAPPNTKQVVKMVLVVLFNQLLAIPATMLMWNSIKQLTREEMRVVPDVYTTLGQVFVSMLAHDCIFYHGHRLFHHRLLYKHMHKIHHEWQAPIAAAANYSHPIEHVLTGQISGTAGILLTGATTPVSWIWLCWIELQIQNDHSGYHFPLVFSPEFHDYHHLKFHTSYGWLSFWDWFYGTDIEFQKTSVIKKRHIRLHTTSSARQIFPEPREDKEKKRS